MRQDSEIFIGLDVAKAGHAVAIAESGRQGEVRFLGEMGADPTSVRRLALRLENRHIRPHFCYAAVRRGKACIGS